MLLPVAGLIQAGRQAHADRYTYLPQIGIYVAVTWLVAGWRVSRVALGGLMAGSLAALMFCAWKQTAYWRDNETLWTHTIACTTDNDMAHNNLGVDLHHKGKVDEAIAQYQMALKIRPDYESAHFNFAKDLAQKGRLQESITHFQAALQIDPADTEAMYLLAWLLATSPQPSLRNGEKAVQLARQANEQAGGKNPVILRILAAAFAETGRFDDAVQSAEKAIELARAAGRQDLARRLTDELQRYKTGIPLHQ
jgi:tetratricopeptide (TPR) repeat protein